MKHISLKILFLLISAALLPINVQAESCNPKQPSFTIDGVEKWKPKPIAEIFKQSPKQALEKSRQKDEQGISIKTLIEPYAKQGHLVISTCSGKSLSIEVQDLFSNDPEKPQYDLTLARKNFFKLVKAGSSKPKLKAISSIKLTTK